MSSSDPRSTQDLPEEPDVATLEHLTRVTTGTRKLGPCIGPLNPY